MRSPSIVAPLIALATAAASARGDEACEVTARIAVYGLNTPVDDLLRVAELAGAAPPSPGVIRRAGAREATSCAGAILPWSPRPSAESRSGEPTLDVVPLRLVSYLNTAYPASGNDGLVWQGRGLSGMASGGIHARWGVFSAALAPELAGAQNSSFEIVETGKSGDLRWSNPFYGDQIDLPQRPGDRALGTWGPGQSYVRVDAGNVAAGISTENLWIGPGLRNTLLMTDSGPGFPHAFVGTSRPGDVWIGKVEALAFWGRLERSRYFLDRGSALLTGLVVDYAPRWVPTLTLGAARVFVQSWGDFTLHKLLPVSQGVTQQGNPLDNQLASLFFRWVFPESGLDIHAEWGRDDAEAHLRNYLNEPDHSQAYVLGLEKVWFAGQRWVRLQAELTHLQEKRPLENRRGVPVWYTHPDNLGYTHEGQVLGASIGPGGDEQFLAMDVFGRSGRVGGFVERIRRNDAYYWAVDEPTEPHYPAHDVELILGARGAWLVGGVEIGWQLARSMRTNRDFLRHNEPSLQAELDVTFPATASPGQVDQSR